MFLPLHEIDVANVWQIIVMDQDGANIYVIVAIIDLESLLSRLDAVTFV